MPEATTESAPAEGGEQRCESCGAFETLTVGDHCLCEACYQVRGSCCTEFDDDER